MAFFHDPIFMTMTMTVTMTVTVPMLFNFLWGNAKHFPFSFFINGLNLGSELLKLPASLHFFTFNMAL